VYETAAEFRFAHNSRGQACLGQGWSNLQEPESWTVDGESHLTVPVKSGAGDMMLELALVPFTAAPFFMRQRIGVFANGCVLGEEVLDGDTSLGFRLPAEKFAGATSLDIVLRTPDAQCPAELGVSGDTRRLGVALRELLVLRVPPERPVAPRVLPPLKLEDVPGSAHNENLVRGFTGLSVADLMMQVESLGHNCEFGLVQRRCGAEPHRLLRFAGIGYRNLLLGLDFGFEGVDDPTLLRCYLSIDHRNEFMIYNSRYGMNFHTFQYEGEIDAPTLLAKMTRDLAYRRRNFVDMLSEGNRLFVFQRVEPMTAAQAMPILTLLRSYGANALLFVSLDKKAPAGTVRLLAPDLFHGTIDRLAPVTEADRFNLAGWISLCANAYRLWRENGGGS
jgi:hypothetical protein